MPVTKGKTYSGYFALQIPSKDADPSDIMGPFKSVDDAMASDDGGTDYFAVVRGTFTVESVEYTDGPDQDPMIGAGGDTDG